MIRRAPALLALAIVLLLTGSARAGGSPETTVVVVDLGSPESMTVAHAWIRWRGIPATNVIYLDDVPDKPVIPIDAFRTRIWAPIRSWLDEHRMAERADLIVYSVGFPYGVDFAADVKEKGLTLRPPISRIASLTAMTYFARHVMARDPARYLDLRGNGYFRRPDDGGSATQRTPTPEEVGLLRDATVALQAKEHEKALDLFERLLATYPDDGSAHYNHACCLALLGRPDDAMAALEQAFAHGWANPSHMQSDPDLVSLREREDFRVLVERIRSREITWQATRGFRCRDAWSGGDEPVTDTSSADRYWLSAMLGYTGPNGSKVEDVLGYLQRATAVDGTKPEGTFYFLENDDVRANTREPLFPSAVQELRAMDFLAEILTKGEDGQDGRLPRNKTDVLGVVAGTAGFDWSKCGSTIVPGAIAEHLTSFGAHFGTPGQTKCVRFLEAGAAGTCGTVAEPYAVQQKFPVPQVHVHYARGVSMAEAIYQSVWGPYQLLVLGDPLARPFATFADVELAGPSTRRSWKGTVTIRPHVEPADGHAIRAVELWVDGRFTAEAAVGEDIEWDTTGVDDGAHDVRLVAVEDSAIGTRSAAVERVNVRNGSHTVRATTPRKPFDADATITISGRARGCDVVELRLGTHVLARDESVGSTWKVTFDAASLGSGTVVLQACGIGADGAAVLGEPFEVEIDAPR